MNRLPQLAAVFLLILSGGFATATCRGEGPNFVWVLSEDNSKHYLKSFDEAGAETPNIDALAKHGLQFEHAFSCGAVCSVARTTLMTSCYGPRIGTQFHRKTKLATLPPGWRMFPAYLREAGYYTTNNVKKDYNAVEGPGVWDASSRQASWRNRPTPETPFFHMQTYAVSHESSLHFSQQVMTQTKTQTDPASVSVPPYYPDTPLFRYTIARYHDKIQAADQMVGSLIERLRSDGLLESTFVFYFGDHGGVLPGSKGYIQERGVHVPLVVRVPKKYRHLVDRKLGDKVDGFVSFVDFGPTLLSLAGVAMPKHFDGKPFLGQGLQASQVDARDEAFSHADRFDEKYDLVRSLRKGRYKYIRNYQAFYPDGLQNNYRYRMLAYQQWRTMHAAGKLNAAQAEFFQPRPVEMLYDLQNDPHEVNNLADNPDHREKLLEMRARLQARLKALPDLSFFPEPLLYDKAMNNAVAFGQREKDRIAKLVDTADLALLPFEQAQPKLQRALKSQDPWERYWALIVCTIFSEQAKPLLNSIEALQKDSVALVRVRAAEYLGVSGLGDPRPAILDVLATSEHPVEAMLTLNTVVHLQDAPRKFDFQLSREKILAKGDGVSRRLEYLDPNFKAAPKARPNRNKNKRTRGKKPNAGKR